MKRVASILTGLSIAILLFAAPAQLSDGQKITSNIPFEFMIGNRTLRQGDTHSFAPAPMHF